MSTKPQGLERHHEELSFAHVPKTPPAAEGFIIEENTGFEVINPIKRVVSGLGKVSVHNYLEQLEGRDDNWFRIELDGFAHAVHITEPLIDSEHPSHIVHFPGFSEIIETGPGLRLHQTLAEEMPETRVISVGTDGIGAFGDKYAFEDRDAHGIEGMAEQRQKLLKALCGDERIIVQGLSMGSVIGSNMLDYDRKLGHELNAYPLYFDTALVTPKLAKYVMGLVFPISMIIDTPRELEQMVQKYGFQEALRSLKMPSEHLKGNAIPMAVQAVGLLKGTLFMQVERVADTYGTTTVSGVLDPLAQQNMWSSIKKNHNTTHIQGVRLRGHGIAADGIAGGKKIAAVASKYKNDIFAA
jgi:hypothetical protein